MVVTNPKRIYFMGSYLDTLTLEETLLEIQQIIAQRTLTQHVVLNANKINLMAKDALLRHIVNHCALINADGQSILWAARFLGHKLPERVTGIDLFERLIPLAEQKGYRVFYFGAQKEVVEEVVKRHREMYPRLEVAGYRDGYFQAEESASIARQIAASQADILFVAFSSPQKEEWIHTYQPMTQVPFAMGVGGSFDVVAGKAKRAPKWMQKLGLEWFYRFIQEPRRMYRRYVYGNLDFLKRVWQEKREMKRS